MKNTLHGNILSVTNGIIVQGCNAQGVMGSGIAAQLRMLYPKIFNHYLAHLKRHSSPEWAMGTVDLVPISETLIIANAITQLDFGRDPNKVYVSYDAIQKAFESIAAAAAWNGTHVHYPQIGAGLGNGDWTIISSIIDTELEGVNHTLWIYTA
jgi:O-acetyl-ADP-ribose deacetylase (regulator of RNase III)